MCCADLAPEGPRRQLFAVSNTLEGADHGHILGQPPARSNTASAALPPPETGGSQDEDSSGQTGRAKERCAHAAEGSTGASTGGNLMQHTRRVFSQIQGVENHLESYDEHNIFEHLHASALLSFLCTCTQLCIFACRPPWVVNTSLAATRQAEAARRSLEAAPSQPSKAKTCVNQRIFAAQRGKQLHPVPHRSRCDASKAAHAA